MPTNNTDGFDWSNIINAALAIYGIKKGEQTPNFYNVPDSPQETWRFDQTKNLYGTASGFTDQYLKGLGNLNPDFQMPNSDTGNPAFMGGVKVPTIDFSKIPSSSGTGTVAPPPAADTPGLPINMDPTGTGPNHPAGSAGDPFAFMPPPGVTVSPDQQAGMGQLGDWIKQHPNIAKGGADVIAAALGLAGGPLAGLIGMIGDKLFRMYVDHATQQLPIKPSDVKPGDLTPATPEGVLPIKNVPINPSDLTPGGQPTNIRIDPATGMWTMDHPSPSQQAWLDAINGFNRNLMTGPGGAGPPTPGPNGGDGGGGSEGNFWDWYDQYNGGGRYKP